MSHIHEQYNHYTHRPDYVSEVRRRNNSNVLFFILGLVFGGMIGFGVGASWSKSAQKVTIQHQIVTEHRIVYDHKLILDKPPVTCKPIYDVSGDEAPYVVIQCSDGRLKVIKG